MKYDCENLTFAFVGLAIAFLLSTLASISFQSPASPAVPIEGLITSARVWTGTSASARFARRI